MDPITRQAIAVAGGAAAGDPLYVDDVFSTVTYEGNGGTATVNNGIDLSGEGGLVWIKNRTSSHSHVLVDDARGTYTNGNGNQTLAVLESNTANPQQTNVLSTLFTSTGFTTKYSNSNGDDYVSWAFRKAPGFFDVQTFTASPGANTISHSLGTTPGMMIVKGTSLAENWYTWHRSIPNNALSLNSSNGTGTYNAAYVWGNASSVVQPTSTQFTMYNANSTSQTYVVYLFAHDDQSFGTDSDEAIIKCGTFNSDSNGHYTVNLGFEPQFLILKQSSGSGGNWFMADNMRGMAVYDTARLQPNTNGAEYNYASEGYLIPEPNGFKSTSNLLGASATFVYMAIRRPHKPPTDATEVFKPVSVSSTLPHVVNNGFNADFAIQASDSAKWVMARLLGNGYLKTNTQDTFSPLGTTFYTKFDTQNTIKAYLSGSSSVFWSFRRAPGFFDVVTYKGSGTSQTISHNLEAVPELIIVKVRDSSDDWPVYNAPNSASDFVNINTSNSTSSNSTRWNNTSPTSTVFTVGSDSSVNNSIRNFVALLFATLDGISKVGAYSGTGYNVNVDCGFTNGARFVMIKRTNGSGDWYVWDTARGIVSGNDPYTLLNTSASDVTNTDYIDPLNAGFTVTSSAPAALNASGGYYIFLAIA